MVDLQRRRALVDRGDRRQRHLAAAGRGQIDRRRATRAELCSAGSASRITRYWLDWVKMVETMRWPKAS